ncbi:hypothetical protein Tco_1010379 [Tanacetum coccineum]
MGNNMVLSPAEFVTSLRNRSDTAIKGVFGYSRYMTRSAITTLKFRLFLLYMSGLHISNVILSIHFIRWPCILNLSLSKLMFWNSINWSGLGRRLAGLLLGGCMFPGNDAWSSLLDLLYSEDVADVHNPKLMARKCSYSGSVVMRLWWVIKVNLVLTLVWIASEMLIVSEGFDEYLNLVLDQAEEVSIKKKTRKPLGKSNRKNWLRSHIAHIRDEAVE